MLLLAAWAPSFAAEESIVEGSKRVVSACKAVFHGLPKGTPSKTAVDGPLLGNGDLGVCIGGVPEGQRFWLCKNDFWKLARDYPSGPSGPRVFGGLDVKLPGWAGAWSAQPVTILVAMQSAFKSPAPLEDVRKRVAAVDQAALAELTQKHAAWWRDFWAKSWVEIGDPLLQQRYYLSQYVRNALDLAIDMSRELGVDAERHPKWRHILDHLSGWSYQELSLPRGRHEDRTVEKPKLKVFRYTEKGTPWWRNNTLAIQHIYPAGAIGLDSPPEELQVARNTIDVRNGWFDGNGMNSFYPAAVRVGYDPKVILAKLREMAETKFGPNGFIRSNPHGIENCSIVPNTINEMLCMGHRGVIRLFPVWPRDRDARFRSLRCWGAFLVSAELQGGVVGSLEITSERGRRCTLQNPWPGRSVTLTRPDGRSERLAGPRLTFDTRAGETLRLASP